MHVHVRAVQHLGGQSQPRPETRSQLIIAETKAQDTSDNGKPDGACTQAKNAAEAAAQAKRGHAGSERAAQAAARTGLMESAQDPP